MAESLMLFETLNHEELLLAMGKSRRHVSFNIESAISEENKNFVCITLLMWNFQILQDGKSNVIAANREKVRKKAADRRRAAGIAKSVAEAAKSVTADPASS